MKKTLFAFVLIAAFLAVPATAQTRIALSADGVTLTGVLNDTAVAQSLYERGLGLASEIYECASSKELLDFMMSDDAWETVQSEGAMLKKSEPTACYELRPDYESFISSSAELAEWYKSLPPAARKRVDQSLPMRLDYNMRVRGVTYAALGAVLTATALFDSPELKASTIYLYVFESSYPVLVTFTKGEGNAVLANASFIFAEKLINASANAETVAEILFTHPFYQVDCLVTQVR